MNKGIRKFGFIYLALTLCLLIAMILPGCSTSTTTTSNPTSTTPVASSTATNVPSTSAVSGAVAIQQWELPILAVKSGPLAVAGLPFHWGADYATDAINAAGGIRGVPLKVNHYDDGLPDTAKETAAASQAIPGSLLLVGPVISISCNTIAPQIVNAKIPSINATDDPTSKTTVPYVASSIQPTYKGVVAVGTKWLDLNPNIKSVAVFYDATLSESKTNIDKLTEAFTKKGVTIVSLSSTGPSQFDFGALVLKAMQAKVDGYMSLMVGAQSANVLKELYNRGMTNGASIICNYPSDSPDMFTAGKGYNEGVYVFDNYNTFSTDPEYLKFVAAYEKQFPDSPKPDGGAIEAWEALYAFKTAAETLHLTGDPNKLNEERQQIVDFLQNAQNLPRCDGGTYNYVNAEKTAPFRLMQIKNNQFVDVASVPDY